MAVHQANKIRVDRVCTAVHLHFKNVLLQFAELCVLILTIDCNLESIDFIFSVREHGFLELGNSDIISQRELMHLLANRHRQLGWSHFLHEDAVREDGRLNVRNVTTRVHLVPEKRRTWLTQNSLQIHD
jgi:hypothetical protein